MPDEQRVERELGQLAAWSPDESGAQRALADTLSALVEEERIQTRSRRIRMWKQVAAVALVLLVVSSATGGVWMWLQGPDDDSSTKVVEETRPQEKPPENRPHEVKNTPPQEPSPRVGPPEQQVVQTPATPANPKDVAPQPPGDPQPQVTPPKPEPEQPSQKPEDAIVKNPTPSPTSQPQPQVASPTPLEQLPLTPEWGHLTGRFLLVGAVPEPQLLRPRNGDGFCASHKIFDESLVVDSNTKAISNVVVYLRGEPSRVHQYHEERAKDTVTLDNKECRFTPHVCLLRTSQTLQLKNSDPVAHNVKIDALANQPMNPLLPRGGVLKTSLPTPERLPVPTSCSVHPWMKAWVLVSEHPYMAVTNEAGHFQIPYLPVGTWTFQFWHEHVGYVRNVEIDGETTEWRRGRLTIEIKSGINNLGEVGFIIEE